MIVVFPNLLSQIINPTRPRPAVESLTKGTMVLLRLRETVIRVILNVNTKTCKGGDFNFVIFFMEMFIASLPMVLSFYNIFVLQEYVHKLMTSTTETSF